jgi:hypothetical protein
MFQSHILFGLFAFVTLILAGAALGRLFGLPVGDAAYLTITLLAVIGWMTGRRTQKEVKR